MSLNHECWLIQADRLHCPYTEYDGPGTLAISGDRIVDVGTARLHEGNKTHLLSEGVLLPGLIDLHAHPACENSKYGINPDQELLNEGTTTVLSQGDAGALYWDHYHNSTIAASRTRVRLAINLSSHGESNPWGCFENPEEIDTPICINTIENNRDHIWGISVNLSRFSCGNTDPIWILERALEVAEATDMPLLYGMREHEDWSLEQQMNRLRPGDVVTYCFRPPPRCILTEHASDNRTAGRQKRVHPAVLEARERGVFFDLGHGFSSFDFAVAERSVDQGFLPDTLSTDYYLQHTNLPVKHSLPLTMSKLKAVGMMEKDIFRSVTTNPAQILKIHPEVGTLTTDCCADLTQLYFDDRPHILEDTFGATRTGGKWEPRLVIRAGSLVKATGVPPDNLAK